MLCGCIDPKRQNIFEYVRPYIIIPNIGAKTPLCKTKIMQPCCEANPAYQCTRCKHAKYCSRQCQITNWPEHKAACKTIVTMNGYATNFTETAMKNKAFLAFTCCLYERRKNMPGKLIVEYLGQEECDLRDNEPLYLSANNYEGIKIAVKVGYIECDEPGYMSVYCIDNDQLFEILEVTKPIERAYSDVIMDANDFNFERINLDTPVMLVVGGTEYCGIQLV